ncbi:GIY-YIG nuclease family protein [Burkholderia sp. S-53]|uniref:GIY-YIG nuclease family protein n=1 Tax=Burkholderia sp. S-53 TaxID=2906514 RepID=UPI0021CE6332|nr:GIY-YIG nuclease family protein [Burkholderia sp. S-53]UXU91426.1 GIY-YIG nuclease family protein [Burkholderia sp. S-53]
MVTGTAMPRCGTLKMAINKNWRDEFDEYAHDNFKSSQVEWERQRQENSVDGWIYIGVNTQNLNEAKVGKTTGHLVTRSSCTGNRHYTLLCGFKIREGVSSQTIDDIENATHRMLERQYERFNFPVSGRKSEWFGVSPFYARELVHDFLYENFVNHMYCYHCPERDAGVIYSWESDYVLNGGKNVPYQPLDLSNPPVSPDCLIPPGCGADCNCW